jgi:hypothetical protein
MANIKELIQSIESPDSSFDEKLAVLTEMQGTLEAMKEHEEEVIDDNVELIIEALRTIEAKVEAKLRIIPEKGEQGIQGQKGEQGDRGLDGAQGRDGKSGIDGKDGLDGKDGISVQDAKIDFDGSLVITLSDGREINVGEVVPVDVAQTIHKIQSGSGGDSQTTLNAIAALQATIATYGTMATQNKTSVDIEGGTIDNTVIGGTTPATGVFTTLTAQTEVLKGTGQNLILYSQTFTNAIWTKDGSSSTASGVTAPDGTSTGQTITESATTAEHRIYQPLTVVVGNSNTWSVYAKQNGRNWIRICNGASSRCANFNIATGVVGTISANTTATITDVGNGWYRCTMTASSITTPDYITINLANADAGTGVGYSYTGNGVSGVYLWGAQVEIGTSANTYTVTTTTAVYGTPTLSFSGVSTIGLESNGSLFVQPAGTGALQAQATTSSAVGGNARGANAVDWQTSRGAASNVASGTQSVIGGGTGNTASGGQSVVVGGFTSTASVTSAAIVGGSTNTASGTYSFVGSGYGHTLSGNYGAIVGGYTNTSAGYYGFIGGGFTNSGTANSAVTTQSGTMNGTTAVTLSGSNANIKVGQLITGTSISFPDTYVAAISGTSLTLSKVASGSSTSTLSFFTPHGVVVGGGNNQATGSYSFIGGGGDAGTAANRNVASGDWSFVGGGIGNQVTDNYSSVVGGFSNTTSNKYNFIGGGNTNNITGDYSAICSGQNHVANGRFSFIAGGTYGSTRGITGYTVFPAARAAIASASGISQAALLVLAVQTTDATATILRSDANAASTTNQVILPNNSAYYFKGSVIANVTGGGNTKAWAIEGAIKRGAGVGTTALVGSVSVVSAYADVGAATWAIAVTADTTNGGLAVTFTGQASTTIRVVARLETTEVTF